MSINKKLLGEAELIKKPQKKLNLTIKDGAVTSEKIKDRAITARKLGDNVLTDIILPLINQVRDSLQSQIDSLEVSGIALSDDLGDGTTVGITQKGITDNINTLWAEVDKLSAESNYKFHFAVTPLTIPAGRTTPITVNVSTNSLSEVFEELTINVEPMGDDPQIRRFTNTRSESPTFSISNDAVVTCTAVIAGVRYNKTKTVSLQNSFWIGANSYNGYNHVVISDNRKSFSGVMDGNYDVTFTEDSHLFVIMKDGKDEFKRADMNGVEIEMDQGGFIAYSLDGAYITAMTYYRSKNTFKAGTYNIDINK